MMSCPAGSHDTAEASAKAEPPPTTTTTTNTATTITSIASNAVGGSSSSSSSSGDGSDSTKPNAIRDAAAKSPETYEAEHVHSVYESIAGHFSSTRYKPWPFVASFLRERVAPGAVGLDVGCGNGKYLGVRAGGDVHMIGSDRSPSLVGIARERTRGDGGGGGSRGHSSDVAVADGLALPFRRGRADFVLCIAVVHHMSTRARRVEALQALLECVRPDGGQVLVYVWALEQGSSRRGWDEGSPQDLLVPWVMKANQNKKKAKPQQQQRQQQQQQGGSSSGDAGASATTAGGSGGDDVDAGVAVVDTTYERFYHLYREGELEDDVRAAGGRVLESGYERDNWWVIGGHAETP
ncbi:S-adenosyl-L-methionine-dependent methyltransferase [Hypoxylon argillaceum]|nr:S-adenosyl-L-methionine-dependent methyltransferase [Hypoxylon argillaceum]